jgi:hypothetical protein
MHPTHIKNLILKVLILGGIIAVLSYLFHPSVGQLTLTINGQPVSEPLIRFAALPTFLAVMAIVSLLSIMIFLGVGLLLSILAVVFAFIACAFIAPYLWPLLAIIFLVILLTSYNHTPPPA